MSDRSQAIAIITLSDPVELLHEERSNEYKLILIGLRNIKVIDPLKPSCTRGKKETVSRAKIRCNEREINIERKRDHIGSKTNSGRREVSVSLTGWNHPYSCFKASLFTTWMTGPNWKNLDRWWRLDISYEFDNYSHHSAIYQWGFDYWLRKKGALNGTIKDRFAKIAPIIYQHEVIRHIGGCQYVHLKNIWLTFSAGRKVEEHFFSCQKG